MKILFVTDLHDTLDGLDALRAEAGPVDLLVVGGDLTNFGGVEEASRVLDALAERFAAILGVPGNLDRPETFALFERRGISLHGRGVRIGEAGFFGVGGSNRTPMKTPNELDEPVIAELLTSGLAELGELGVNGPVILVSHTPPFGTTTDRLFTGKPAGSRSVRALLEREPVALCVCGHIHEAAGLDRIGAAEICNPGDFAAGRYALITIEAEEIRCELRRLTIGLGQRARNAGRVSAAKAVGFVKTRWLGKK